MFLAFRYNLGPLALGASPLEAQKSAHDHSHHRKWIHPHLLAHACTRSGPCQALRFGSEPVSRYSRAQCTSSLLPIMSRTSPAASRNDPDGMGYALFSRSMATRVTPVFVADLTFEHLVDDFLDLFVPDKISIPELYQVRLLVEPEVTRKACTDPSSRHCSPAILTQQLPCRNLPSSSARPSYR
jgi:hypothetical protein